MTGLMNDRCWENCVTYVVLILTFALTLRQAQGCQLNSSPHPDGVCGDALARAHANLCFLLRQKFPQHFPNGKRASPTSIYRVPDFHKSAHPRERRSISILDRLSDVPVSALAQLNLTDNSWRSFLYKRGLDGLVPWERNDEIRYTMEDLQELPAVKSNPTRLLIRMLSKRSSPAIKRSTGLVCECCINECSISQLATYC